MVCHSQVTEIEKRKIMDLNELRLQIDHIDDQLVHLFSQRMAVSARIADYKKENGLPIFVPSREAEKLQTVSEKAGPEMAQYTRVLYDLLFELSRGYQSQRNAKRTVLYEQICQAMQQTEPLLPRGAAVACMDESESQLLAAKRFPQGTVMVFTGVDGILSAVSGGMCRYGIVELNSDRKAIYDLLASLGLFIVYRFRLSDQRQYLCVSRQLEIYPGADRCCIRMALANRPGALHKVISRLYTLGINVSGLECRAMEDRNFQGMFYFDLETSVYSPEFVLLICELEDLCQEFYYLGSYTEVV